ncbi:MAG TPA: hypothetical protein VME66_13205, partial [Candidatus Acidoferrales bacterium]|nr:hypothetical protein [Candidatus Acidoferrales bacterium]
MQFPISVACRSVASAFVLGALLCNLGTAPVAAAPLPTANIVLPSAISVDPVTNVVVLPLHKGFVGKTSVWY